MQKLVIRTIGTLFGVMTIAMALLPTAGVLAGLAYVGWDEPRFESFRWALIVFSMLAGACVIWRVLSIREMSEMIFGEPKTQAS